MKLEFKRITVVCKSIAGMSQAGNTRLGCKYTKRQFSYIRLPLEMAHPQVVRGALVVQNQ